MADLFGFIGDIAGALIGADAAKDSARTQSQAADRAIAETRRQYDQNRQDLQFQKNVGNDALKNLWTRMQNNTLLRDYTLDDFQADPGYQFRQAEGNRGVENSAAARGMQLSGATLKALSRFNQGLASDEYARAYQRDAQAKEMKYNMLSGLAGMGQAATNTAAGLGAQAAGNISDAYLQAGNAQAAGRVGQAQAWGNAINSTTDYYRLQNLLKSPSGSSGSSGSRSSDPMGLSRYGVF